GEAQQFAGHDLIEAVEAGDAVAEGGNGADLVDLHLGIVVRDLLAKNLRNLVCLDLSHLQSLQLSVLSCQSACGIIPPLILLSAARGGPCRIRRKPWYRCAPQFRPGSRDRA